MTTCLGLVIHVLSLLLNAMSRSIYSSFDCNEALRLEFWAGSEGICPSSCVLHSPPHDRFELIKRRSALTRFGYLFGLSTQSIHKLKARSSTPTIAAPASSSLK